MDIGGIFANQPLVIDNGSSSIKSGIAGEPAPSTVFASYVGRPKHERAMIGSLEGSAFVGPLAQEHRGLLSLAYPMQHGVVRDWGDLERVWQHAYASAELQSEEHPVLMTEAPVTARRQREAAAQILFESLNVPACYFAVPAVLSLYASGKTTGLALDVGDGVAHCVPVYEGFAINAATMRSDLAGANATDFLQLLLWKQGVKLMTSAEREVVKHIKELHSFVVPELAKYRRTQRNFDLAGGSGSDDEYAAVATTATSTTSTTNTSTTTAADGSGSGSGGGSGGGGSSSTEPLTYRLPDGQRIRLSRRELSRAPELLFRPHIFGLEERTVHQLVIDAVSRSDLDLRAPLYQSIVLSGGATLTRGFGERLLNELKDCAPSSTKLRIYAPANRLHTAWIGGSILAGLSTFKKMWLTAQDWEEQPSRIHLI